MMAAGTQTRTPAAGGQLLYRIPDVMQMLSMSRSVIFRAAPLWPSPLGPAVPCPPDPRHGRRATWTREEFPCLIRLAL
jgi:hypothetical protein